MAETSGLLNRRTGDSRTEGSNPSVSANHFDQLTPSSVVVATSDALLEEAAVGICFDESAMNLGRDVKVAVPLAVDEAHEQGRARRAILDFGDRFGFDQGYPDSNV